MREALSQGGHSRPEGQPAAPRHPAEHWVSHGSVPTETPEHGRLFETGYLNTDGTSEGDAEAYESETESEADELDHLAQTLQVGLARSEVLVGCMLLGLGRGTWCVVRLLLGEGARETTSAAQACSFYLKPRQSNVLLSKIIIYWPRI